MSTYRPGYIEGKVKVGVYMDPDVRQALKVRAAETGESMSDIVERAIRKELDMVSEVQAWQLEDRQFISDATGFDHGDEFTSEEQVREYFTVDNMRAMFGECSLSQDELDEMAEAVIANRWHMVPLNNMIHWRELRLFDTDNQDITDEKRIVRVLQQFKDTGTMYGAFFHRIGVPHEDPDDASTWGPESAADVDWTGFPGGDSE